MRELINLLVLPLLALILLALYFYPDRLEDLISWVQDFFRNYCRAADCEQAKSDFEQVAGASIFGPSQKNPAKPAGLQS